MVRVKGIADPPGGRWVAWGDRGPVASVISHTARVLVALPRDYQAFWNWLWDGQTPQTRFAATHGVEVCPRSSVGHGKTKFAKENKSGDTCDHFGINLSLGGEGNKNPASGNLIVPDGTHGHLYFALSKQKYWWLSASFDSYRAICTD